jgi:hypothetical protein
MAAAVRADVARQLALEDASTLSVTLEAVTWSDGSLGCPRPDRVYTQAVVPGWRIVVGDGRRAWTYHAARGGQWVLCPPRHAAAPPPGTPAR